MKSPGKPSLRRDVERQFWCEIAKGLTSVDAALVVGVRPGGPRPQSWWSTLGCGSTCKTGCPARSAVQTGHRSRGR